MAKRKSKHYGKHHVKLLKWIDGVLDINDHDFDTYELAVEFCNNQEYDSLKIYDAEGNLIFEGKFDVEFYA